MGLYILKRILILVPTLFIIMVVSFMISRSAPGDPVQRELDIMDKPGIRLSRDYSNREYRRIAERLGLDKPIFYFSLTSQAYPDTLHRILRVSDREALSTLVQLHGNWDNIAPYYHSLLDLEEAAYKIDPPRGTNGVLNEIKLLSDELRYTSGHGEIDFRLEELNSLITEGGPEFAALNKPAEKSSKLYQAILENETTWKLYVPSFRWHGFNSQFHHWLSRMLVFDFGKSERDKLLVSTKIKNALPWTVFMGFFSFLIAYMIAIPIGVYSVRKRNTWQDSAVTTMLFLVHSVPSFVAAMFVLTFFCNPEYLYIFPTSGVISDGAESWGFFARMKDYAYHLTLPTIIFSYGSVAFLSRQMRVGMLESINTDYIRTARAKGLSEQVVIWKHAMRNSILPLLTHFATLFPRLVGGAVITETIFAIPGMGRLTIDSAVSFDHPTLVTIFTIGSVLSLLGILVADILYTVADPRIKFTRK